MLADSIYGSLEGVLLWFLTFLHLSRHTIPSCCGVQQGNPLVPLCFALTLHSVIEKIKREVPDLLINVWYLDDGTLCGSSDDLLKALNIIEEEGPPEVFS